MADVWNFDVSTTPTSAESTTDTVDWSQYEKPPLIVPGRHRCRLVSIQERKIGGTGDYAEVMQFVINLKIEDPESESDGMMGQVSFWLGDKEDPTGTGKAKNRRQTAVYNLRQVLLKAGAPMLSSFSQTFDAVAAGQYYVSYAVIVRYRQRDGEAQAFNQFRQVMAVGEHG
jgi:hypothetical protein